MKKNSIIVFILCVVIFLIFYIYEAIFILPVLSIDGLEITGTEATINENNWEFIKEVYGINQDDLQKAKKCKNKLKYAIVTCTCQNDSFFKKLDSAQFKFEENEEIPNIIIGTNPEAGLLTPVNIKAHGTTHFGVRILIDSRDYSDDEIMEILKDVKITMISKNKENVKVESKPVSLVAGAKS